MASANVSWKGRRVRLPVRKPILRRVLTADTNIAIVRGLIDHAKAGTTTNRPVGAQPQQLVYCDTQSPGQGYVIYLVRHIRLVHRYIAFGYRYITFVLKP
jgi:hypothetical protein